VDFGKATMVFNNSFLCRGHNLVRELWERFSGKITQKGTTIRRNHYKRGADCSKIRYSEKKNVSRNRKW
jgi:hypothetical protein